jgi:hypothetical protein
VGKKSEEVVSGEKVVVVVVASELIRGIRDDECEAEMKGHAV